MSLFRAIAFVLFVIAAVIAFLATSTDLRTVLGFVAAGLAAFSLDAFGPTVIHRG